MKSRLTVFDMGCVPSKNDNVSKDVTTSLLAPEDQKNPEPHAVQTYEVSSSEEEIHTLLTDRKNTNQFANTIVNQITQDLIDVPSLAYTLYGTNSPYNYCEEYNGIISSVRIVDGILNVSMEPEVDMTPSVEELLTKPSNVDVDMLNRCSHELQDIVDSMKIQDESIVVEF